MKREAREIVWEGWQRREGRMDHVTSPPSPTPTTTLSEVDIPLSVSPQSDTNQTEEADATKWWWRDKGDQGRDPDRQINR